MTRARRLISPHGHMDCMPCAVVLPMIAIPETPPMSSQQGGTLFLISSLRMSKRGGRGSSSINYDLESGKEWDRRYRCVWPGALVLMQAAEPARFRLALLRVFSESAR